MANAQIRTHFDSKVILTFAILFLFSLSFLIVKKNLVAQCNLSEIKVEGSQHKVGDVVVFSDISKTSDSWEWNFGDNEPVEFKSKVNHVFKSPGLYKVRLTTGSGCYIEKRISILPSNSGFDKNKIPMVEGPRECFVGESITFKDLSSFATSWEWRFGESGGVKVDSKEKIASYSFEKPGVKYASLVVNGDIQHMKKIEIFVKEREAVNVIPNGGGVVEVAEKLKPEIESDDELIKKAILGVSSDKLSYVNFSKYFCVKKMPKVIVNEGKPMTLQSFDNKIRKQVLNISVKITRNGDCPTMLVVDYTPAGIFQARSKIVD